MGIELIGNNSHNNNINHDLGNSYIITYYYFF